MTSSKEAMTEDGKKIMCWTDSADRQLFLACLASHDLKIDPKRIADSLGCTIRAVQERLKFLKKIARKEADVGSKPAAARAAAKNPPPPAVHPNATLQKKRGPKVKGKVLDEGRDAMEGVEGEEEGEETPRPVKKRKRTVTGTGKEMQLEEAEDDEEVGVAKKEVDAGDD
ncbi:MAG: hypothetical protein Q9164_002811 [Protoblastenia rupestris]